MKEESRNHGYGYWSIFHATCLLYMCCLIENILHYTIYIKCKIFACASVDKITRLVESAIDCVKIR